MSKYRVFELAKEFGVDTKEVIAVLKKNDIKVANNFSGVDDEGYNVVKAAIGKKAGGMTEVKKPAAKPAPKPTAKPVEKTAPRVEKESTNQNNKSGTDQKNGDDAGTISRYATADGRSPKDRNRAAENARNSKPKEREREKEKEKNQVREQVPASRNENRKEAVRREEEPRPKSQPQTHSQSHPQNQSQGQQQAKFAAKKNESGNQSRDGQESRGNRDRRGRENGNGGKEGKEGKERRDRRNRDEKRDNRRDHGGNEVANNRRDRGNRKKNRTPQPPPKVEIARPKHIKIGETIAVKDLASKMSYTAAEIIKKLMQMGVMASINQDIDYDTAALVASEFGVTTEELPPEVDPTEIPEIEEDLKAMKLRPPVVTVMGHVDHGKTSLLDVIRKTSVTTSEAGGITQHIGAYQVMCKDKKIVFLDTPGHEAFTAMRARGAQVTDIAILVVAADDGVMPQTVEAINHAKSANVPIIVAINKIDKPGANPERVKQELMEHGLVPEEYGGDNIMVPVSAKKQIGINDLLENILLVAEVQELKANPAADARGVIIEAQLDKGRGPVATVLVQNGTLRIGDSIVAGTTYGKVRAMVNDRGDNVKKAGPSVPVEVLGLNDVPAAGDLLASLDEKQAKSIAEHRIERERNQMMHSKKVSLDAWFQQIKNQDIKDLNIVVKADVQGSVEALNGSLLSLNKNDEVRVSIVHSGVGAVNESDIMLASASNAIIIAFNVRPDANARRMADTEGIDIRTYRVIYDALDDVKAAMSGMLAPKYKEVIQGRVEIRKVMKFSKALVAGSYVLEGKIQNNSKIRILRDNVQVFDGAIDSLRRFKDEVKEVAAGYECGISIVDFRDFKEGDIIEAYVMEEIETSIAEANKAAAERRAENEAAAEGQAKSTLE